MLLTTWFKATYFLSACSNKPFFVYFPTLLIIPNCYLPVTGVFGFRVVDVAIHPANTRTPISRVRGHLARLTCSPGAAVTVTHPIHVLMHERWGGARKRLVD